MENYQEERCLNIFKQLFLVMINIVVIIFVLYVWGITASTITLGIVFSALVIRYLLTTPNSETRVIRVADSYGCPGATSTEVVITTVRPTTTEGPQSSSNSYGSFELPEDVSEVGYEQPPSYLEALECPTPLNTPPGSTACSLQPESSMVASPSDQDPVKSDFENEEPPTYEEAVRQSPAID